jgi:hypothetical protein
MEYIELTPEKKTVPIVIATKERLVPKRETTVYELSTHIKNISEEVKSETAKDLPG